ncbi:MAG TPA: hypothetical protein VK890_01925, partial [Bacteroidia bacterium]|nr:hypothetical protein [Bacteroidia bacterium]
SVVAIRGEPVANQSLGSNQDGYVLTFDFTDGYWRAAKSSGSGSTTVQNGSNYGKYLVVYPFASSQSNTNSTTFVSAASFEFDPTAITAANGTRTITMRIIAHTTTPLMSIQLYNLTTAAVVTGSTLTTSSTTPVTLTTADLTANLTNGLASYQVQIMMAGGGTGADRVTLDMAILKVVWL